MAERIIQVALRLPASLHGQLKALAERERRSLHAEILVLLDEALAARTAAEEEVSEGKAAA